MVRCFQRRTAGGQVAHDAIDNVAPEDIAGVQKDSNLKLYPRAPLTTVYVAMNNTFKPFDNEKVRQAVAMAIDRKRITDNFYAPGSVAAEQFAPPGIQPGNSSGMQWYKYDPAAAKKALADAGYPNGFDITLSYRDVVRPYLPSPSKVAQDIQAQLKDIGINVKLQAKESGAFLDSARSGKEPFFLLGWFADFPDATNFFDTHFSTSIKQWGTPYSDIATEIAAGGAVSDPAERQKHYDKVNELLKLHVPMVPLAYGTSAVAFKANVKGAHSSPFGDESFYVMDNGSDKLVFMQNAEPITLWCGDEADGETFRTCIQLYEPLLNYEIGGTKVIPALAESFEGNKDATVWTFHLRKGAKFFDGQELDANDVVATYAQQWDVSSSLHKGRQNLWTYFGSLLGACLNSQKGDGDCAKK